MCLRMTTGEAFAISRASAVTLGIGEAFKAFASPAKANLVGLGVGWLDTFTDTLNFREDRL
jgi:hypothetical protein